MGFARQSIAATYGQIANSETDPLQQVVLLYNGAIKFLKMAATDIENGDIPSKAEHTDRALDILGHLQSTLDFERGGDVAPILDSLYVNIMMMVLKASTKLDAEEMKQAAALLEPVRDAWAANARSNSASSQVTSTPRPLSMPAASSAPTLSSSAL